MNQSIEEVNVRWIDKVQIFIMWSMVVSLIIAMVVPLGYAFGKLIKVLYFGG